MSRYDGLIIPRSYSEYINKTDAATLQQALQLPSVLSGAVDAGDNKPVKSKAIIDYLQGNAQKTINGGLSVDSLTVSGSDAVKKSDFNVYYFVFGSSEESFSAYQFKDIVGQVYVPNGKYLILLNLSYESFNNTGMFYDFMIIRNDTLITRCYTGSFNTCSSLTAISDVNTGDRIGLRVKSLKDIVCHFTVSVVLLRLPF